MEIRRSEVFFGTVGSQYVSARARQSGCQYYAMEDHASYNVWDVDTGRSMGRVSDLIDDRPSPFPPLPDEPSSDTPVDRARAAALREAVRSHNECDTIGCQSSMGICVHSRCVWDTGSQEEET